MAETTLGRLQKQVEQLSKQVVRLQDNLEHQKQEKKKIKKQFDEYKKNVESIIEKAVNQAVAKVTEHYEKIIKENLNLITKGRTTIIIAHRLSTIKDCDLIVCFNEGEIVEKGTHKELLEKNGYYKNLYDAQM